jgi:hypothetical protein
MLPFEPHTPSRSESEPRTERTGTHPVAPPQADGHPAPACQWEGYDLAILDAILDS